MTSSKYTQGYSDGSVDTYDRVKREEAIKQRIIDEHIKKNKELDIE